MSTGRISTEGGSMVASFEEAFLKLVGKTCGDSVAEGTRVRLLLERLHVQTNAAFSSDVNDARMAIRQSLLDAHGGTGSIDATLLSLLGAAWHDEGWSGFAPRAAAALAPRLTRIGDLCHSAVSGVVIPALIPFLAEGHILLRASGAMLATANQFLEAFLLRLIVSLPPGRVRFVLIDPGGRGKSFAALTAFHEVIRGGMVWDDKRAIAEQLVAIKSHVSNVQQRYLKHEFSDIESYNRQAGDIAEPFRVVAVAGFPQDFDSEMANDILKIATTGVRTGVHLAISFDTARQSPRDFPMTELERLSYVLDAGPNDRFASRDLKLGKIDELRLDRAPETSVISALVRVINPLAAISDQIQISFSDCLKLQWAETWTGTTVDGIAVPIGLTGARELLVFELAGGSTVVPHALIAGKTGYGKSNLLHAFILGLCHHYGPDELELYLVDMKEGVEFAAYGELPHARVVALESNREFALGVLRGLAKQLERRGEQFRGVSSEIGAFRRKTDARLPRIVLLIDEFQVLYSRSDAIRREANSILTDLTKRGRAFGIHVVLASQSLRGGDIDPGALAQVGVRAALQLDELDSTMVLGKDNDAARYLVRRGEAIYNNKNGLPEGNVRFQAALLDEKTTSTYLHRFANLAKERGFRSKPRVFAGNAPATVEGNASLRWVREALPSDAEIRLFLGEPFTLQDDDLSYGLVRQRRSNLMLIGQDESTAAAVFVTVCASAIVLTNGRCRVFMLNLARVGTPIHRSASSCSKLSDHVVVKGRSDVSDVIRAVREVIAERTASADDAEPALLAIFGLHQAENDFPGTAYGNSPLAVNTKQLSEIIRLGPDCGVHVLVWSSTYASAFKILQGDLVEFDGRVAFTGGDSAKVLGDHGQREELDLKPSYGAFYDQETRSEIMKFRCYGDIAKRVEALAKER